MLPEEVVYEEVSSSLIEIEQATRHHLPLDTKKRCVQYSTVQYYYYTTI
jgi:hypothetical protein